MKYTFILALLVLLFTSCKENSVTQPLLYLHGDMEGYVHLVRHDAVVRTDSGVAVSVEGTALATTTDDRGHWRIPGLATGTYTIRIARDTFGYVRVMDFPFVGGGAAFVPDETLIEQSLDHVRLLDIFVDTVGWGYPYIGGLALKTYPSYPTQDYLGIVMDTDSTRIANHPEYAPFFYPDIGGGDAVKDSVNLEIQSLRTFLQVFTTGLDGARVFARVAFLGSSLHLFLTRFFDPHVGRTIYSGTGEYSNVVQLRIR